MSCISPARAAASALRPILTTKRTENVNEIQSVLAILEGTPVLLRSSLEAIPEPARKRRLIPGQWSAHERVIHLASIHPVFALRLERMLAEDHPPAAPRAAPATAGAGRGRAPAPARGSPGGRPAIRGGGRPRSTPPPTRRGPASSASGSPSSPACAT